MGVAPCGLCLSSEPPPRAPQAFHSRCRTRGAPGTAFNPFPVSYRSPRAAVPDPSWVQRPLPITRAGQWRQREREEEEGVEVFSVQQVPRRRSPQQIAVIQPRSIWQRARTSRGSRCHAAALLRRPGAPGIGSAVPGEDGAPQLPFPELLLASGSPVLSRWLLESIKAVSPPCYLGAPWNCPCPPDPPTPVWSVPQPGGKGCARCEDAPGGVSMEGQHPWAEATRFRWPPAAIGVRAASPGHL